MHSQKKKKKKNFKPYGDLLPAPVSTVPLCLIKWELSQILATHLFDKRRNSDFQPWKDLYRKDRLWSKVSGSPAWYYNICAGVYVDVVAIRMWLSISPTRR